MKYIDFKPQPYCGKKGHNVLENGYCAYCYKKVTLWVRPVIIFLVIVIFIFLIAGTSDFNTERIIYGS